MAYVEHAPTFEPWWLIYIDEAADLTLGATLILLTLIALPGNILALKYFVGSRRRDLATLLYILISSTDICISLTHFPVTTALFNQRKAGGSKSCQVLLLRKVIMAY